MAYSYNAYVGDSSTTIFNVQVPYLLRDHISLLVDGVEVTFTWLDSVRIQADVAPVQDAVVWVKRTTPVGDAIVDYQDGSVLGESEMDASAAQSLFIAQETKDETSALIQLQPNEEYDAQGKVIGNVADPIEQQDVVTKEWAETAMTSELAQAIVAKDASEAAQVASETAQGLSETAQAASEAARNASAVAQGLSETARDASIAARDVSVLGASDSQTAQGLSETAKTASEAARDLSVTAKTASQTAQGLSETARDASIVAKDASEAALDYFTDRWLGAFSSNPLVDNDGDALLDGATYWNTSTKAMRVYNLGDTSWNDTVGSSTASFFEFTATGGQTVFTGVDNFSNVLLYTAGFIVPTLNGVVLDKSDYIANDGLNFTLNVAATAGDSFKLLSFGTFDIADVYTKAEIDANLASASIRANLVGEVVTVAHASLPTDFLECNGASLLRSAYPELFTTLGAIYGAVDVDHFNLPDYRGEFLRGWDNTASNDPDAATRTDRGDGTAGDVVGSKQSTELGSHKHIHGVRTGSNVPRLYSNTTASSAIGNQSVSGSTVVPYTSTEGGNETRPRNVNVMYCIRYQ